MRAKVKSMLEGVKKYPALAVMATCTPIPGFGVLAIVIYLYLERKRKKGNE